MWPFKKKLIETRIEQEPQPEQPAEKELPALEWTHIVGIWHKEEVCEHCGHAWDDGSTSHDGVPCPTCGCIGSHKVQVVRHEYERTQVFDRHYPETFRGRGIDIGWVDPIGMVDYIGGIGTYWTRWRGIRNEKTVIWDGCSVKKDSNDE